MAGSGRGASCAAAVNEAKPRLRREQVFVVGDLALLEEEGGLGSVFTTLVSARRVRDALRLRSGHQPATVGCPAGGLSGAAEEAVLDGTLLGSLPAQAEPETAAGLTHEHVVSYGAQDAVDCSTRPPDPPQALEWLTEFFGTLEGDGGGSERQEPNLPTTTPTPDSLDHSQGGMTPRQQALHVARQRIRGSRLPTLGYIKSFTRSRWRLGQSGRRLGASRRCMPC